MKTNDTDMMPRPISSAPRNGERILIYDEVGWDFGSWSPEIEDWKTDQGEVFADATYWLPEPQPPKDE